MSAPSDSIWKAMVGASLIAYCGFLFVLFQHVDESEAGQHGSRPTLTEAAYQEAEAVGVDATLARPKKADRKIAWNDLWRPQQTDEPKRAAAPNEDYETLERAALRTFAQNDGAAFVERARQMRAHQPDATSVHDRLDGATVEIFGYLTPLGHVEGQASYVLVPQRGAGFLVPTPSANQMIYLAAPKGEVAPFTKVRARGIIRVEPHATVVGEAGYTMEHAELEVVFN